MNFNITDFLKLFGSVYKIAWILFISGLFLILSGNKIRELFYLQEFITQYGTYIGIVTLISGVITILNLISRLFNWFKNKRGLDQATNDFIEVLSNLSLDEKFILAHFLGNKTQTSNLGIEFESLQTPKPVKTLMARGYIKKSYVGVDPHFHVDSVVWDILQKNWQEIFYEDEFQNN
ncbi:super-infection exclusion protein B [Sulfurimonas sp.]|uniref:super-infection exclusion protein B n=1 Tax=Sulfurimonas sp. TaxID=2022749 RepID=UPI0025FE3FFA|nr:super-infection exclusion protein B [Sulfurimonas sp.]MCK9454755.1 superinfection exclusion B family protein [Sulfurimonas sp.]